MALQVSPELSQFKPWILDDKLNDFTLNPTPVEDNAKILHTYIVQRIPWYSVNKWTGGLLWEYYQDDFRDWNQEMVSKCNRAIINLLRNFLVKHGVYIPRDRRTGNDTKLLAILKETEVHEWTREEVAHQIKHGCQ